MTSLDSSIQEQILEQGYAVLDFENLGALEEIQKHLASELDGLLTDIHEKDMLQKEHTELVFNLTKSLEEKQLVQSFVKKNKTQLIELLGPDIDIQKRAHLRISRPDSESDLITWHRDTFYGNSPWEVNLWFPVFPLEKGAGLNLLAKTHSTPAKNIRVIEDANEFRHSVEKGSIANQIGYAYMPKTDDMIDSMKDKDVVLLAPKVGQAVIFMGCMVHRAQNLSNKTRVSIDLRLKSHFAPTSTAKNYYTPLTQGPIQQIAFGFAGQREEWKI